jgi:hypothetical protein
MIVLLGAAELQAQIKITTSATISTDAPTEPHAEPYLAVNPRNPRNLVVAAIRAAPGVYGNVIYTTHDGGRTWKRAALSRSQRLATDGDPALPGTGGADPSVYFDANGRAYFVTETSGPFPNKVYLLPSTDGGRSWGQPVRATLGDRAFMGIDGHRPLTEHLYVGTVLVGSTFDTLRFHRALAIAASHDGGASFNEAEVVLGTDDEAVLTFGGLHVGPRREVYAVYQTLLRPLKADTGNVVRYRIAVSRDYGNTFAISAPSPAFRGTFREPHNGELGMGFTTAIDLSGGPHHGRIYIASLDGRGARYDLKLTWTDDAGQTWSAPVMINDNRGAARHGNPAMAVNRHGVIGLMWYDRRRLRQTTCYDVYLSGSVDGGRSFLPNVRANEHPSCSAGPGNWLGPASAFRWPSGGDVQERVNERQALAVITFAGRFAGGGDVQNLQADANGVFHGAWVDGSSGTMQLRHSAFRTGQRNATRDQGHSARRETRREELGPDLAVEHCQFDWSRNRLDCAVHLVNPDTRSLRGPFALMVDTLWNVPSTALAEGADNGVCAIGAAWAFPTTKGSALLAPGEATATRVMTWRFARRPNDGLSPIFFFKVHTGRLPEADVGGRPRCGPRL